jgi:nucleotide-binding universal stress UspA family protein
VTSIQTILAPVDLSKGAQRSVREAALLASKFNATLLLLHAEPVDAANGDYRGEEAPGEQEAYEMEELAHLAENEAPDADSELLTVSGDVPDAVRQVAEERAVDMIVMPTRGKGAYKQFVLGPNTTQVLREAACPVLTGAHVEEPADACHTYRRIACLIDLKEGSAELLRKAHEFAEAFGASLTLVHIPPEFPTTAGMHKEFSQSLISSARFGLEDLMEKAGINAPIVVKVGQLEELLPPWLEKGEFDLLVIGRNSGAKANDTERPSAKAYAAICCSPCPVLSF